MMFEAIGTHWVIAFDNCLSEKQRKQIEKSILQRIAEFDKTYSRFRQDSLVMRMSRESGTYTLPDDAQELLTLYKKLYALTDHAFTPLIGDVLVQAGYDAQYSLKPKILHPPLSWGEAITYQHPSLTVKKPTTLDFGAVGKGYLIDLIGTLMEKNAVYSYTINAGGDMLYKNTQKKILRVGLEHPAYPDKVIGIARVINGSICCSAGNRRKWHNFHHIINPHTLSSPRHILSTWVIAKTARIADAIATCLFFVPAKKLFPYFDFSSAVIHADYSLEALPGFPAEFFTTRKKPHI